MKSVIIKTILIFAFLLAWSCSTNESEVRFSNFHIDREISGTEPKEDQYFKSGIVGVLDSLIVVMNTVNSETQIHLFESSSLTYLCSGGRIGRGPGEISNPGPVSIDSVNRGIWFMDYGKQCLWYYSVDSIIRNPDWLPHRNIPIPPDKPIIEFSVHHGEIFSFPGGDQKVLLSYFNNEGAIIDTLTLKNDGGLLSAEELSFESQYYTATYHIKYNSDQSKYFVAYRFSDVIEIFDREGHLIKRTIGPQVIHQIPDYTDLQQIVTNEDCYADKRLIYIAYMGNSRIDKDDRISPNFARTIHVYDWSGNPVARLRCDYSISSLTVDPANFRIVTFSPEVSGIVCYSIPEELKRVYNE